MILVIQCAARKNPDAGWLRWRDGRKMVFVADPDAAPGGVSHAYARPDDVSDTGASWRTMLCEYNSVPRDNPHGLLPAWRLYENPIYGLLAEHCGQERFYILSAGWGLIQSDFLTPAYDITFSPGAERHKRRRKKDQYDDFNLLPKETGEDIVFFGGKDYVGLFCALTDGARGTRYLWYNSKSAPKAPGCVLRRFHTRTRINWHYECARAFIEGKIQLEDG